MILLLIVLLGSLALLHVIVRALLRPMVEGAATLQRLRRKGRRNR